MTFVLMLRGSCITIRYGSVVTAMLSDILATSNAVIILLRVSFTQVPKHMLMMARLSPVSMVIRLSVGIFHFILCSSRYVFTLSMAESLHL